MFKKRYVVLFIICSLLNSYVTAGQTMQSQDQLKVVNQYLADLQNADYKDIAQLFLRNGFVISTSRGKVNAKEFFYNFLPNVVTAHTQLKQVFINTFDSNRISVRFHFNYQLKNGDIGDGEYVDEFLFDDYSLKLRVVYMFENLKFK